MLSVISWQCPSCGRDAEGAVCPGCVIPAPPPGMVWIEGDTLTLDGILYEVGPFYIDSGPVTWRSVLPWLNSRVESLEDLAWVITGVFDENLQFIRYTPLTSSETGDGLGVPAACLDMPAGSFTLQGAAGFLASEGRRLPTVLELALASRSGVFAGTDVFTVMSAYSSIMEAAMGPLLGRLQSQAMFAGYSTAAERVMWEWTTSDPADPLVDLDESTSPCATVWRPSGTGVADRGSGYFNIAFRGVVGPPPAGGREDGAPR